MSRTLSDCPVFITNMSILVLSALEFLHELDRSEASDGDLLKIDRAISILTVGQDACELFVADLERCETRRLAAIGGADVV